MSPSTFSGAPRPLGRRAARLLPRTLLALVVGCATALAVLAQAGYEEPPVFRAADRVAADLLTGPNHRLDDRVVNDGFMNHFVVHSDFGDFEASSERMVATRVREVYAIAKLRELSRTDAFSSALKGAATAPIDAAKQIADKPVETLKGVPGGVTRKVRGLYYKGRKTAHQVDGEIDEAREKDAEEPAEGEEAAAEDEPSTSDQAAAAAKDWSGYNSAKRELAKSLQVDPYSTNPVLQAELTRLAQAAFTAGLGFKMVVPGSRAIGLVTDVSDLVWDTPPEELERLNNLALRDMGIDKDTRLAFFASDALTTTVQTLLVKSLERLSPLDGRGAFIELAIAAEDEADAWLLASAAQMLASHHELVAPIARLVVAGNDRVGRVVVGVTEADAAIVPVPFDHVTWQAGMEGEGPLSKLPGRELWISGTISPRAKSELERRGFAIRERASAHLADLETRRGAN